MAADDKEIIKAKGEIDSKNLVWKISFFLVSLFMAFFAYAYFMNLFDTGGEHKYLASSLVGGIAILFFFLALRQPSTKQKAKINYCSNCNIRLNFDSDNPFYQCPKCGAKLDAELLSRISKNVRCTRWKYIIGGHLFLGVILYGALIGQKAGDYALAKPSFYILFFLFGLPASLSIYFHYKKKDGVI
jgi:predicted RNA-binding Zn-ribbon protein involved in translation (DUF1610 family)